MINYLGKCLLIEENGEKSLVIGDLHLGYEETLNRGGVLIDRKMFDEMIKYFDKVFEKTGKVDKVILLGDVKHDFGRILRQEWKDVLGLFEYLRLKLKEEREIIIVRGNHDSVIEPIAFKAGVLVMDFFVWGRYCFMHGDVEIKEGYNKKIKYWIVGHGHPAIELSAGAKREKYKCFLAGKFKGREIIIVPSFFSYSEGSDPRDNDLGLAWNFEFNKFRVKIAGDENLEVLDFGLLGKLK